MLFCLFVDYYSVFLGFGFMNCFFRFFDKNTIMTELQKKSLMSDGENVKNNCEMFEKVTVVAVCKVSDRCF